MRAPPDRPSRPMSTASSPRSASPSRDRLAAARGRRGGFTRANSSQWSPAGGADNPPRAHRTGGAPLSFRQLFHPAGIAVIGASADLTRISGQPVKALKNSAYPGKIYLINPKYEELHGLPCFPDVKSLPSRCELAIVAVPAPGVAQAIRDCGAAKIPFAVVLTAGFRETGAEGRKLEQELKQAVADSGVRIVGPNCP